MYVKLIFEIYFEIEGSEITFEYTFKIRANYTENFVQ